LSIDDDTRPAPSRQQSKKKQARKPVIHRKERNLLAGFVGVFEMVEQQEKRYQKPKDEQDVMNLHAILLIKKVNQCYLARAATAAKGAR
jgi:hypothetical protein